MSDLIKALTSAPHGATHIGFYGDDIIFIKEYEESRSDAWGFDSKEWQDIEDFDVSLIYGVRAIKDVKTEAELLKQIEQIKAERDALAKEVDAANDRIGELTEERDALVFQRDLADVWLAAVRSAYIQYSSSTKTESEDRLKKLERVIGMTALQCLRDVQAEAGRKGYAQALFDQYKGDYRTLDKLKFKPDEYAATVRQGGE